MFKLLTITRKSQVSLQEKSPDEGMSTKTECIFSGQNDEEAQGDDDLTTPLPVFGLEEAKVNPWLFLRMPKRTKSPEKLEREKLERTIGDGGGGHRSQNASWGNADLGQMSKPSASSSRLQNALRSVPSSTTKLPDFDKLLTAQSSQERGSQQNSSSLVSSLFCGRYQQPSKKALTDDSSMPVSSRMRQAALALLDDSPDSGMPISTQLPQSKCPKSCSVQSPS
jgi:hypothetical protein